MKKVMIDSSSTEVEVLPSEDEQASNIGDEVSEYYPEGG